MSRSRFGGRHELGQNFLHHKPTLTLIAKLVARTHGAILEIGPGDGSLTRVLTTLQRPLTAIEIDEHRARKLQHRFPKVEVQHGDALRHSLNTPNLVGNLPFHVTTPILRHVFTADGWCHATLMTQWEVARKRAGVGGVTMMTAQVVPWFEIRLHGRVPSWGFTPKPSVDGGVITIQRRREAKIPVRERHHYNVFVKRIFTGRGRSLPEIIQYASGITRKQAKRAIEEVGIEATTLPRNIKPVQWPRLWESCQQE